MNLKLSLRVSLLALVGLLAACGSGGGDNECLIQDAGFCDGASSGGTTGGGGARKLTLTCPPSILAGTEAEGFSAKLTNGGGSAGIKNTFISLVPTIKGTPNGTVIGVNDKGVANEGISYTDSAGVAPFTVKVPATEANVTGSTAATVVITASNLAGATQKFSDSCTVKLTPNPIRLTITGPEAEPSGAIEIEAGKAKAGFVARLTDSAGNPIPDIDLTPLVAQSDKLANAGSITTPGTGIVTDAGGRVFFRYQSPTTVTDVTDVNLVAQANANGFKATKSYLVRVYPKAVEPPEPLPTLEVTAPTGQGSGSVQVVSGETYTGYFVQLLRSDGTAIANQTVTLTLNPGTGSSAKADDGAIRVVPARSPANVGITDSAGKVFFTLRAPLTESISPKMYTVTAAAKVNNTNLSGEFTIRVVPTGTPKLTILAPSAQPSGSVLLAASEHLDGFVANLLNGQDKPLANVALTLTATAGTAKLAAGAGSKTDIDGNLRFDYTAPAALTAPTQALIRLTGTADGYTIPPAEYVVNLGPTTIEITGPAGATKDDGAEVVRGKSLAGFRMRLTDGVGRPLVGVRLAAKSHKEDETAAFGSIATVAGRTTTDSDGAISFTYNSPSVDTDTKAIITASAAVGGQTISSDFPVLVTIPGIPKLTLRGPADQASGRVELLPNGIAAGLRATLVDGAGEPIKNKLVTLTADKGSLVSAEDSSEYTNSSGQISFDYTAPATISARSRATVTAQATADGRSLTTTYQLVLVPTPPAAAPLLTLEGPPQATPGEKATNFKVTFSRADDLDIEGAPIKLIASSGTVAIMEDGVERPGLDKGRTDLRGELGFVFTPTSTSADTTVQITASYDSAGTGASSELTQQCKDLRTCTAVLNVSIPKDTFRFTSPAFGAKVPVGVKNAKALEFLWQTSAGAGVAKCIDLDTTFQGSSNAPYGLVVGTDPTPLTQVRRVQLTSSGKIQSATPVAVYSDRSGQVTITASENPSCEESGGGSSGLSASTAVQFVDVPGAANNHVDLDAPLKVTQSADTGAQDRKTVTLDVRNNAYGVLDGEQVLFCLSNPTKITRTFNTDSTNTPPTTSTPVVTTETRAIDPNERVFPGGGTTSSEGKASTQYFVPALGLTNTTTRTSTTSTTTTSQTATIEISGCVRATNNSCTPINDGRVCSTRQVQIVPAAAQ